MERKFQFTISYWKGDSNMQINPKTLTVKADSLLELTSKFALVIAEIVQNITIEDKVEERIDDDIPF